MHNLLVRTIENLPPLPETVVKLQSYVDSAGSEVRMQEVVNIISRDPLLTGELLRLANSPFYGFSREIVTIQQVVSLLGINNIKNAVIANSINSKLKVDMSPYGLNTQEFLASCSLESSFITNWLIEDDKQLAQILVPCSMLMRLGMILLAGALIEVKKDQEFLEALKESHFRNVALIENEFCGVDHISFLGFLFDHWKFDEVLIQSISYIPNPHAATENVQRNVYALAIANRVFEPYTGGTPYNMSMAKALFAEAKDKGIVYSYESFVASLPVKARENLNIPVTDFGEAGF
ncbi:HDOD domain-containing protein [Helicobacter monodelphidis]|uniref:HDOD domain-containing protein n=1 Tax=Helicobacter sp. 15-1451 TaxID=2004995 RepID=UPI000DCB93AB|nr:HDOD domain-containing protein [Helicobacter sp. 15-1451]RAX56576.1 HDOD domain-containing protein [Helicobacter sp. 15-1451]